MTNRKLTLIIICTLLAIISVLFFYGFRDIFARKSSIDYNPYENENDHEPVVSIIDNNDTGADTGNNPDDLGFQNENISLNEDISPVPDSTGTKKETTGPMTGNTDNKEYSNIGEEKKDEETKPQNNTENTDKINILFLGIDRTAARDDRSISFSSDAIMLASIDIANKKADILSIPRDSYVHIPIINKKDKIAYSFAYGYIRGNAAKSTIDTINALAGNPVIDYYFSMDMEPIPQIVDELGGIEIYADTGMAQIITGDNILDYIRWRYSEEGDIGRIKRHHAILRAMFGKITSYDKEKLLELLLVNEQYINTDMGIEQIVNLAGIIAEFDNEDIRFSILPGTPQTIDNVSYWIIDEDEAKKLIGGIS